MSSQTIFHVSAECFPIAKVGGLADVVGALPKYQNALGAKSSVIMPFFNNKFTNSHNFSSVFKSKLKLGKKSYDFRILKLKKSILDFPVYFVDIPKLLYQDYVYSNDDTERFLAFQIATLDWMLTLKSKPNIIHCHDHHTGLLPFMLQECDDYKTLNQIPTVTTIHNAQYQGWFSHDQVGLLPKFNLNNIGLLDWNNAINPLAAAIKCAWRVTTVSPSYMKELMQEANGLENLLSHESKKCVGILNGIDSEVWNPQTDEMLVKNYSVKTIQSGKNSNKKWLCKTFKLDTKKPLFAFIGRLVGEKGADLLPEAIENIIKNNNASVLVLGSGFVEVEKQLLKLKNNQSENYNAYIGYDEKLSHLIYAGADFLLMPSRVEPCGLNQMYALRYGTIPIVRNVGGLKDTVLDIDEDGFGIVHQETTVKGITKAVDRAIDLFQNQKQFKKIRKQIMEIDHSWTVSAKAYMTLYNKIK